MAIPDADIIVARMARPGPAGATVLPAEWTAAQLAITLLQTNKAEKSWTQHGYNTEAVGPLTWDISPGWQFLGVKLANAPANSTWMVRWMIGDYLSGEDAGGITWEISGPSGTTLNAVAIGTATTDPGDILQSPIVAINTGTAQEFLAAPDARGWVLIEGVVKLGEIGGDVMPAFRTATGGSGFIYAERSTLWAQRTA